MPQFCTRQLLTLVVVASTCFGCGSDQKPPANTPEGMPPSSPPAEPTVTPPGEPNPSGQPSGMPPADPESRSQTRPSPSTLATPQDPSPAQVPAVPLSQSQVAMVADLANTAEIEQGKLAQSRAQAASVKKFASMMVKHHTDSKQEQAKLFQKLNITPAQSQKASALKDDADRMMGTLRGANGAQFDVAYMNSQVEAHQKVLETIDRDLLPAATDAALIDGLKKMRATVESHLTEAKTIQAQLTKVSSTTPGAGTR